jgi:hypothetical protein
MQCAPQKMAEKSPHTAVRLHACNIIIANSMAMKFKHMAMACLEFNCGCILGWWRWWTLAANIIESGSTKEATSKLYMFKLCVCVAIVVSFLVAFSVFGCRLISNLMPILLLLLLLLHCEFMACMHVSLCIIACIFLFHTLCVCAHTPPPLPAVPCLLSLTRTFAKFSEKNTKLLYLLFTKQAINRHTHTHACMRHHRGLLLPQTGLFFQFFCIFIQQQQQIEVTVHMQLSLSSL